MADRRYLTTLDESVEAMTDEEIERRVLTRQSPIAQIMDQLLADVRPSGGTLTLKKWMHFRSLMIIEKAVMEARRG